MRITHILCLLIPAIVLMNTASATSCEDCHSTGDPRPSGGFAFTPPVIRAAHDSVIPPGEDLKIDLWIIPTGDYRVIGANATLEIGPPVQDMIVLEMKGSQVDDRILIEFNVGGLDIGVIAFAASVAYTVQGTHRTPGSIDRSDYAGIIEGTFIVDRLALKVSPGYLILDDIDETMVISIEALEDAYDISIEIDGPLQSHIRWTQVPAQLKAGERISVPVTLLYRGGASGNITVSWYSNGSMHGIAVPVSVIPERGVKAGIDLYHELGKYIGIASMLLLIAGYFTGGTGMFKKPADRSFGGAGNRIKFHCAISYEVLLLSLFHLALLLYGPFRGIDRIMTWQSSLGAAAMVLMIVIALNGIFQKGLVKAFGPANWRRVHAWGSYLATCLVVLHALLIGSHFYWFRSMIGAS